MGAAQPAALAVLRQRMFRALKWQYCLNVGLGICAALYILAVGRILGNHLFGVYVILTATPTLILNVFDLRLQESVVYFFSQHRAGSARVGRDAVRAAFQIDAVFRSGGLIASLLVGLAINRSLGLGVSGACVALASAAGFLAKVGSAPAMGLLRARERLNVFATLQMFDWIARLALLAVLHLTGNTSLALILGSQCLSAAIFNSSIIYVARSEHVREYGIGLSASLREVIATYRAHKSIFVSNQLISIMDSVVKESDTIIVGYILSVDASGIYKIAKNFATIVWRAADPIYIAIMPILSTLWAEGRLAEMRVLLRKMTVILFAASIALYALGLIAMAVAIHLILGASYAEAGAIYPFASVWVVFAMPLIWSHSLAIAAGASSLQAKASAIGNCVGLAALCLGAFQFGLPGAAAGLSVAFALPFILATMFLTRSGIVSWRS